MKKPTPSNTDNNTKNEAGTRDYGALPTFLVDDADTYLGKIPYWSGFGPEKEKVKKVLVPHCDCSWARAELAKETGAKLRIKGMVPTKVKGDNRCIYCAYYVFMKAE